MWYKSCMSVTRGDLRPLHILIPTDLHARLKEMSNCRDRSVAAETRQAIEARLHDFDAEQAEPLGDRSEKAAA
jgi:hypothetical protein